MKNIFGENLQLCSCNPMTGFYRDGFCRTDEFDKGKHVVCVIITDDFLRFSFKKGNDLITPHPEYYFQGLKAGDKWCLCALRWKEAFDANCAPKVVLEATAEEVLQYVSIEDLIANAYKSELI